MAKIGENITKNLADAKIVVIIMAAVCIFAAVLSTIVFPLVYLVNVIRYKVLSTPLNMHHPAFVFLNMLDVTTRWTAKNAFLSYRVFLLIPVIMMMLSFWITMIYWKEQGNKFKWSWHIASIWTIPVAILAITVGMLAFVASIVRGDSKAIRNINRSIQSKMTTAITFNTLSDPNVDRLTQITKYQALLKQFETDDPLEYAKALFTVNLYLVMYEMGSRHENIDDALRPFQGYARLQRTNFARFLSPQSVYLPNRLNEITINSPNEKVSEEVQQKAVTEAGKWIADINNKLGSITYTSTSLAFILLTMELSAIYLIPLVIASKLKAKRAGK